MLTVPNIVSLLRLPLAFVFLQNNPFLRAGAIIVAMVTDWMDGFLARRYQLVSRAGTFLDPLMDKFFVLFVVITLIREDSLDIFSAATLLSRDFAVLLFGFYLTATGRLTKYHFRAIWCGKASTALQFVVLLLLNFGIIIPAWFYSIFILLGGLALFELYLPTATQSYGKLDA